MYLIYNDYSVLTSQTGLPPNQLTSLKVKNLHNFGIFQPIWLKLVQVVNGTGCLPPNQPKSEKRA